MPDHIRIYRDDAGEWRWVRIAANNERLSSSTEGYENRSHAIEQAQELNPDTEIQVDDDG